MHRLWTSFIKPKHQTLPISPEKKTTSQHVSAPGKFTSSGLSASAKVSIAGLVIFAVLTILANGFFICRRRQKKRLETENCSGFIPVQELSDGGAILKNQLCEKMHESDRPRTPTAELGRGRVRYDSLSSLMRLK